SGIVTIEDLIEEVMGNILDEYDESEPDIKKLDSNTYLVNGLLPISELNEYLHLSLESENTDTIGGFIINLMGSIPTSNDCPEIKYENLTFKIEEVNEKRIEKLKLSIDN
ncbi:MAG: hemolysin, partial [Clostridiales bacterium]|nr:hemolysin [Clostridiales bacterium]